MQRPETSRLQQRHVHGEWGAGGTRLAPGREILVFLGELGEGDGAGVAGKGPTLAQADSALAISLGHVVWAPDNPALHCPRGQGDPPGRQGRTLKLRESGLQPGRFLASESVCWLSPLANISITAFAE